MTMRISRALPAALVLAGGVAVGVGLQAGQPGASYRAEPPAPLAVYTEPALRRSARAQVQVHGEVRAHLQTEVNAEVTGRIVAVSPEFVDGGQLAAGEPLLCVDDTEYRTVLAEAVARQAAAEVELRSVLAEAAVARDLLRHTSDPVPLARRDPQVASAEAALSAAKAGVKRATTRLSRTCLSLPYDARLLNTRVALGQFVTAGQPVAEAFSAERVDIRVALTHSELSELGIVIGQRFAPGEGLPVTVSARPAGTVLRWSGTLTRVDPMVHRATGAIFATVQVNAPYTAVPTAMGSPLAVGMFVDLAILGPVTADVVSIPEAGLRAGDRVFVRDSDGRLAVREVDILPGGGADVLINDGLEEGEQVVISAVPNAVPGMPLARVDSTPTLESLSSLAGANPRL